MPIPSVPSPLATIVLSRTYNAAWFPGTSNEAKIQNMINGAIADGATVSNPIAGLIPTSMISYNAALVTFNDAVPMFREGNLRNVLDVTAYGALGTADAGISFNAARSCAGAVSGLTVVYAPEGSYALTTAFTFAAVTNVILWLDAGVVLSGSALPSSAGTNQIIDFRSGSLAIGGDISANGGYRQTIDGWYQENAAASQTDVALTRLATTTEVPTRWIAVRAGSVTGVNVKSNAARIAGSLTIKVFKNGTVLGTLTAVLDGTNTTFKATTQAKDTDTFVAGDELELRVTTDGSWSPVTADIRAALEIES